MSSTVGVGYINDGEEGCTPVIWSRRNHSGSELDVGDAIVD